MSLKKIIVAVILFTPLLSRSQPAEALHIGDRIPVLRGFEFYGNDSDPDFLNKDKKLIILDFWNVYCATCIEKMPEMEALQKQFQDAIEIVLVTNNKKEQVDWLFSKIKRSPPKLKMIVNDTLLNSLFRHQSVPHHVWINSEKTVKYISYGYNTNAQNILTVIEGREVKMKLKQEITDFDRNKPLWLEGRGRLRHHLKYYSLLMERIDEVGSSSISERIDSLNNLVELKLINRPLLELFKIAFNEAISPGKFSINNHILIEVRNPEQFNYPTQISEIDDWKNKALFSYEAIVPLERKTQLYKFLQDDLSRYFKFQGKIEKRKIQCLVLIKTSAFTNPKRSGDKEVVASSPMHIKIRNSRLGSTLAEIIAHYNKDLSTPVVDGTDSNEFGDLDINVPLKNINLLRKALQSFGFDLVEQEREMEMLIISDNLTDRIGRNTY